MGVKSWGEGWFSSKYMWENMKRECKNLRGEFDLFEFCLSYATRAIIIYLISMPLCILFVLPDMRHFKHKVQAVQK